jgi:hypothetical protein
MADKQNLGQQRGMHEDQQGRSHQSPGRNPQDDQSAHEKTGGHERKGSQFESDIERNRQDKGFKEGGQNEQTRR